MVITVLFQLYSKIFFPKDFRIKKYQERIKSSSGGSGSAKGGRGSNSNIAASKSQLEVEKPSGETDF